MSVQITEGDAVPALASASRAKRWLDRALGLLLLLLALPILVLAAFLVFAEDRRAPFFCQWRAGLRGRPFMVWKLRSMAVDIPLPEAIGQVRSGNAHVTRVGSLLRRLKIDELPQLFNVVRGEMSLVGPRPTLPEQAAAYGPRERERLAVLPGMTGWAQVNGNISLPWEDRIALDRWYVRHWSFGLDLRILLRTVAVIFAGERVSLAALEEARKC